jgi:hypothetical protein
MSQDYTAAEGDVRAEGTTASEQEEATPETGAEKEVTHT